MRNFKLYKGKLTILHGKIVLFLKHNNGSFILTLDSSGGDEGIEKVIPKKDLKLLPSYKGYYSVFKQDVSSWLEDYTELPILKDIEKLEIL